MAKCEHVHFATHFDVLRNARYTGGPIEQYILAGGVQCCDCGLEFRAFRILLEPMTKEPPEKPSIIIPQRVH